MTIIRSPEKITTGFYIADKRNTENKKLSWAARGLLTFLLGKPDNWSVVIEHLIDQTKESAKPTGRDGIYSIINELIAEGYIIRTQSRIKGKISGYDYIVYSSPQHDLPHTDLPHTAETTLISNDFDQENKLTKNDLLTSKEASPATNQNPLDNVENQQQVNSELLQDQDFPTLSNGFKEKKEKSFAKKEKAAAPTPTPEELAQQALLWAFIQADPYWRSNASCKTPSGAFKHAVNTRQRERGLWAQFCEYQQNQSAAKAKVPRHAPLSQTMSTPEMPSIFDDDFSSI